MDGAVELLRELIELQRTSIRLQKSVIVLQAEAKSDAAFAAQDGKPGDAQRKYAWKTVRQMRATVEKVAAGKKLPK